MHMETLDILRCPYCGGRLDVVPSMPHQRNGDSLQEGILGCQCCIFPVVDGVPVLHLHPPAVAAREHIEAGRSSHALRAMIGLDDDAQVGAFEEAAGSDSATYQDIVTALGPRFEGGYFLYRFSDPTYVVADAVVRAVAGTVLRGGGRAVDLCGGSGHLTRTLAALSPAAPVLADLYFTKVWLARRFTAPGCEPVCCDGNAPLPFARGAFTFAICSDAFQFIWTKRQFVGEMHRLIGGLGGADAGQPGAVVISHTHNQLAWSPSHGNPLSPAGYLDLFEEDGPRIFSEARLFAGIVDQRTLDLGAADAMSALDADPALTIVASRHPGVFAPHPAEPPTAAAARGELRLNPLYEVAADGDALRLRLRFPSRDYEDEFGACRRYLPDDAVVSATSLAALAGGAAAPELDDLVRRRVIVDLPRRYY